jgi:hypothetical protein
MIVNAFRELSHSGGRGGCLAPQLGQKTAMMINGAPQFTQYLVPRAGWRGGTGGSEM